MVDNQGLPVTPVAGGPLLCPGPITSGDPPIPPAPTRMGRTQGFSGVCIRGGSGGSVRAKQGDGFMLASSQASPALSGAEKK
jgi:hypothetical protein